MAYLRGSSWNNWDFNIDVMTADDFKYELGPNIIPKVILGILGLFIVALVYIIYVW